MSTLADELLNDFEESGSEGEDEQQNGLLQESATPPAASSVNNGIRDSGSMVLDGDEEDEAASEEAVADGASQLDEVEDEEEAKAKVEKMQLGGVSDVRTVAGLMRTLEPVLEVSTLPSSSSPHCRRSAMFTEHVDIALTFSVACRKLHITKASLQRNRTLSSARSRTTLNIIF